MEALRKWRLTVELKIGVKLLAVRSDSALELKFILNEWGKSTGIEAQYSEVYTFRQNGVPERDIRTTENNVRAMIKEAGLLIEFWPEAAMISIKEEIGIQAEGCIPERARSCIRAASVRGTMA